MNREKGEGGGTMGIRRWRVAGIALMTASFLARWVAGSQAAMKVGFSVSTQVNPFYKAMADGVRDQAKAEGFEVTVLNAEDKLEKQIADVEDLIQKKIDVLLINATHDGAAAVLNKAADAGIPVITLQRGVPGAKGASRAPPRQRTGRRGPPRSGPSTPGSRSWPSRAGSMTGRLPSR